MDVGHSQMEKTGAVAPARLPQTPTESRSDPNTGRLNRLTWAYPATAPDLFAQMREIERAGRPKPPGKFREETPKEGLSTRGGRAKVMARRNTARFISMRE